MQSPPVRTFSITLAMRQEHPCRDAVFRSERVAADNEVRYAKLGTMAHHKRKRPKHRRSGCLLCKPHKLATNAKGERRRSRQASLEHERAADEEAEAIAAERINSGAADHKEDGTEALAKLGIDPPDNR